MGPDLFRRIGSWVLWTPRRLAGIAAAALILLFVILSAAHAGHPDPPRPAVRQTRPAAVPAVTRTVTASPAPSPSSSATTAPPQAPQAAILAAENFAAAWVSGGRSWLSSMRPYITRGLAAQLAGQKPAGNPATRITGAARVTQASAQLADLSVPTDAGPALVTVVQAAGKWRVSSVMLARTGN